MAHPKFQLFRIITCLAVYQSMPETCGRQLLEMGSVRRLPQDQRRSFVSFMRQPRLLDSPPCELRRNAICIVRGDVGEAGSRCRAIVTHARRLAEARNAEGVWGREHRKLPHHRRTNDFNDLWAHHRNRRTTAPQNRRTNDFKGLLPTAAATKLMLRPRFRASGCLVPAVAEGRRACRIPPA